PGVGHEVRVLACELEIDVGQRLLGLVHDQPEQAKVAEHPPEQCLAARAADFEERPHARPDPEPAGNEVSVLGPGEHPRDRAQVGERSHAGAPGVPRFAYLNDTTSPCSVRRSRPWIEPAGCAAIARPVGAPPRLTEPPRPWKKATGMPHSPPSRVSLS